MSGVPLTICIRNPAVYQDAMRLLAVKPDQCAMVAAHINDLRAAAQQGMRTIYVRRPTEDLEFPQTPSEPKIVSLNEQQESSRLMILELTSSYTPDPHSTPQPTSPKTP